MVASFVSGEIGTVDNQTIVITFSESVSNDIVNGVTIRVNNQKVDFTAQRQSNHSIIYYTIPACDSDDSITWEYSTVLPNIWDTHNVWTKEDFRR